MGGRYSTTEMGFLGLFFSSIFLLYSTPGSQTRKDPKNIIQSIVAMTKRKIQSHQLIIEYLIPDNSATVGAPSHPRLAIGSTVLTNNRDFNPFSIQRHNPNWWAWKLFSTMREGMNLMWPTSRPGTHTHHTQKLSFWCFYQVQWSISKPTKTLQESLKLHLTPKHAFTKRSKFQWWAHTHTTHSFNRLRRLF